MLHNQCMREDVGTTELIRKCRYRLCGHRQENVRTLNVQKQHLLQQY